MSEQGWQAFLSASGVEDWVVLHGGAAAVFLVPSLVAGAQLAEAIAAIPSAQDAGVLVTLADDHVAVRLTRGVFRLEERHVETARAISAAAHEQAVQPDRARVQEVQLAVAAQPTELDIGFWRAVLGYEPLADDNCVDPLGHGSTVWMQELDPSKPLRHAMHVDVSVAREHAEARVAAALAAGGRVIEESEAPAWWVLADRAGNRVCVVGWPDGAVTQDPARR